MISPATYALVQKATGDLGTADGPLMRFKPWMLAMTLQGVEWQKAGFDPELGLDKHFYDRAKAERQSRSRGSRRWSSRSRASTR